MTAFIMSAFNTDIKIVKYAEEKRQVLKDALKLAFYQRFHTLKNKTEDDEYVSETEICS